MNQNWDLPWDWEGLSRNRNITIDFIKKNIYRPWNWYQLSKNPNVTVDFVKENIDKPWDWCWMSYNPNIPFDFVKQNIDKPWNWVKLSRNLNITFRDVLENIDLPWNWFELSFNDFNRNNAAIVIQRFWRRRHWRRWKYNIILILGAIRLRPPYGIEYLEWKEEMMNDPCFQQHE